ncbi:MAG TPA: GNAT family N-acetyltransferase [Arenicellales bacterium]|nr:GNAT family N-acetyltransferase [Arenicellales bacterium]
MQDDETLVSSRHNPEMQEANFRDALEESSESPDRNGYGIRGLTADDAGAVHRIDRRLTGQSREDYLARKIDEVINQSGIRVSLVAESDGLVVGYIMARLDYGEFGRTSAIAVIDTIGVDPGNPGAGTAMLEQLFANLASLRLDGVRTIIRWDDTGMIHFLSKAGFEPGQQLALRCVL